MKTEHTPLPWHQMGAHIYSGGKNGGNICSMSEPRATTTVEYTKPEYGSKDADEMWANAALIVRAVNSYADMLAALEECEEFLDSQSDVVDGSYGEPAPNKAMSLLVEVRAAIRRAKGEG